MSEGVPVNTASEDAAYTDFSLMVELFIDWHGYRGVGDWSIAHLFTQLART